MKAPGVKNAFHPRRLGVTKGRPGALDGYWRLDSRMLKITSLRGVSKKLWGFECGDA